MEKIMNNLPSCFRKALIVCPNGTHKEIIVNSLTGRGWYVRHDWFNNPPSMFSRDGFSSYADYVLNNMNWYKSASYAGWPMQNVIDDGDEVIFVDEGGCHGYCTS
jgi:hypothetical protein